MGTINTERLRARLQRGDVLPSPVVEELLDEIDLLRAGQGHAPVEAQAGPVAVAFHESHPIPDSTRRTP